MTKKNKAVVQNAPSAASGSGSTADCVRPRPEATGGGEAPRPVDVARDASVVVRGDTEAGGRGEVAAPRPVVVGRVVVAVVPRLAKDGMSATGKDTQQCWN